MAIHLKAVEQYLTVLLFGFQSVYPVCNFGKFISFGLATVRNEKVQLVIKDNLNYLNISCLKSHFIIKRNYIDHEHLIIELK